jgi:hypothetical protein
VEAILYTDWKAKLFPVPKARRLRPRNVANDNLKSSIEGPEQLAEEAIQGLS